MNRLNGVLQLCLVGACAAGLLSGCATAPPSPAFPTSYVAKPSPTNFIYEAQQSPNKSTSKVVIAIVRPRLEKEESKQLVQERVQGKRGGLAAKEVEWRRHHRSLQEQYHRETQSGSIFSAAMTQSKLRQAEEVLKLIDLLNSGEKEVSDGVRDGLRARSCNHTFSQSGLTGKGPSGSGGCLDPDNDLLAFRL